MGGRTRVQLGRREDLGADCANCFGLCCVALAFSRSVDFPVDKPAGEPCTNLDPHDACRIHPELRDRGWKGCTVFDCSGAGQKVSRHTFAGRSWRDDAETQRAMFATFPVVRRLHELLRYLDEAITLVEPHADASEWRDAFEHVRALSDGTQEALVTLDVDAEYGAARDLLLRASEIARGGVGPGGDEGAAGRGARGRGGRGGRGAEAAAGEGRAAHGAQGRTGSSGRGGKGGRGGRGGGGRTVPGPGSDLLGADLSGADLRGATLRGSVAIAADLSGADLRRCDLLGVDLRDADLRGADLGEAIYLTQMQVNAARGDAATVLPSGFERPSHWG
ncbi:pentapeptide repeat-containing protein [Frigoribacterium salinisoli]